LPKQVAAAIAGGFQPTVYAAQALGLTLSGSSGNGGTGNSFASQYGALSTSAFATTVATATGINANAIQGWVTYWLGFYTANPGAIPSGSSVTLAAYGAALGDAVGEALLLFPSDGTPGGIVSAEVQNALYDNA
jgi:3D (Asp-Asp-Asp) domain-containing protein